MERAEPLHAKRTRTATVRVIVITVAAAVLAGCDDDGGSEGQLPERSADPADLLLSGECDASELGYLVAYPDGWHADDDCTRFHPEPVDRVEEHETAVTIRVVDDRTSAELRDELLRTAEDVLADEVRSAAGGHEALHLEVVTGPTGEPTWAQGTRVVATLIDAGDRGLAMTTTDRVTDLEPEGYDLAVRTHSQMRRALTLHEVDADPDRLTLRPEGPLAGPPGHRFDALELVAPAWVEPAVFDVALLPCEGAEPDGEEQQRTFGDRGDGYAATGTSDTGHAVIDRLDGGRVRTTHLRDVDARAGARLGVSSDAPDCALLVVFPGDLEDGQIPLDDDGRPMVPHLATQLVWEEPE